MGDRFTETAQNQANCLNLLLNAFEIRNPAGLSQVLGSDLIPLVESCRALFDQEIIPYLKNSVKKRNPEWSYDA